MPQQIKKQFLSARGQMFVMFLIPFLFLCGWSLSAFWQHIDDLAPTYKSGAYLGAAAGEAMLLILIYQKCFSVHLGVRKWALIFAVAYGSFILFHTSGLRGMNEAAIAQDSVEQRLREQLTGMSKEQAGGIQAGGRTQKERLANERKAKDAQAEVYKNAQDTLAKEIAGRAEKIKDQSILPRWYLDGWMYGAIFIVGMVFMGITAWLSMNKEDIDADYDGTPDKEQQPAQQALPAGEENPFPKELPENGSRPNAPRRQ